MDAKDLRISQLEKTVQELIAIVKVQLTRIEELEAEVLRLKTRKNSGNSSLPPSMDKSKPAAKPNQSLRTQSDKKSGGQVGHKGETLQMSPNPDQIEPLLPTVCSGCSHSLEGQKALQIGRRQVVDLPPIKPIYIEYQQFERTCPCCGLQQAAQFPAHVQAPIQYGPGVMSTITYLYARQFIPFKRSKELMSSLFGLSMSEGSIANLLERMVEKAMPVYEAIRQNILESGHAGADETGCKVNGKKHWIWTLQNELNTFIWQSETRGYDTLQEQFSDQLQPLILTHDCWAAYFQTGAAAHQLCLAHLSRDLQYLKELHPKEKWVSTIQGLFSKALALKRRMTENPTKHWLNARSSLEQQLKTWVEMPLERAGKEVIKLQKRLQKHFQSLTTCLHHLHIPPDNNGSERAIRNVKVKQKVSGQFKSVKGADIFAVLRSVIDSLIKNDQNVFLKLVTLAKA